MSSFHLWFWKIFLMAVEFQVDSLGVHFMFSTVKMWSYCLFHWRCFWYKTCCHPHLCSSEQTQCAFLSLPQPRLLCKIFSCSPREIFILNGSILIIIQLAVVSFGSLVFGAQWTSRSCGFIAFMKFRKFSAVMSSDILSAHPFSLCTCRWSPTYNGWTWHFLTLWWFVETYMDPSKVKQHLDLWFFFQL